MNVYETNERIVCGTTVEEKEVYDKGVILVTYLNKEHDLNKKYEEYDELLIPLMFLLNNVLDYEGKQRIIEEYGFDTKKIKHVRNVMNELNCSYQRATSILKLSEDEKKNIEKYFQS